MPLPPEPPSHFLPHPTLLGCYTGPCLGSLVTERIPIGYLFYIWYGWNSNVWTTSCEELTHWKRPWCWEGLGAGGEGDDRGWDGWMASPTLWTWVWVNSGSWQGGLACCSPWGRKELDTTERLNWTDCKLPCHSLHTSQPFPHHPTPPVSISLFVAQE